MINFFLDLEPLRGQVPVDHPAKIEIAGLEALPSLSLSLSFSQIHNQNPNLQTNFFWNFNCQINIVTKRNEDIGNGEGV